MPTLFISTICSSVNCTPSSSSRARIRFMCERESQDGIVSGEESSLISLSGTPKTLLTMAMIFSFTTAAPSLFDVTDNFLEIIRRIPNHSHEVVHEHPVGACFSGVHLGKTVSLVKEFGLLI